MLQQTTKELRVVVVKLAGKPPKVAIVVRTAPNVVTVRLATGRHQYAKPRKVEPGQVTRDATPRERDLGFVPPEFADRMSGKLTVA